MIKVSSLTAAAVFSLSASAVQFDPPDLRFEYQLHQSYLTKKGMSPNPVSGTSESYRLQKGETLWTLSEMLYGDGHYWPRVWQQNRGITNPHLVRQGHTLQFILGSEDQTPAFRFSEEDDGEGLELAAAPGQNPIVEIPPPEVPPKPVIKVPPSFPEWQSVFRPVPQEFTDDRNLGRAAGTFANRMYITAWAQESKLDPVGYFMETDREGTLSIENQYVYIKLLKGVGRPGMKLLAVKDMGPIKRVNSQLEERIKGHAIQVAAEIEISEEAPSNFKNTRERNEYTVYRALITRTLGLTLKNTSLIEGKLEIIDTTEKGRAGSTDAFIIGAGQSEASALYGPGDLVFLNKGASHGVEPGQLLSVFADRRGRHRGTPVQYSSARAGTIKVVKVTPELATAFVLNATEGLQQGDHVREASAKGSATERFIPAAKDGPSSADDGEYRRRSEAPAETPEDENIELESEIEDGEIY
jgi:hypothetical protein